MRLDPIRRLPGSGAFGVAMIAISFWSLGCGRDAYGPREYFTWLNDERNGLVVSKTVGELEVTVKYVPPEVRAYQEIVSNADASDRSVDIRSFDSLRSFYARTRCFVLTIGHSDPANRSDVATVGISGREAFAARLDSLNFGMGDALRLVVGGKEFEPALVHLDGDFGLSAVRRFTVVFVDESSSQPFDEGDSYTVLFNDPVFHSGSNRFPFMKNAIENRPDLAIGQLQR